MSKTKPAPAANPWGKAETPAPTVPPAPETAPEETAPVTVETAPPAPTVTDLVGDPTETLPVVKMTRVEPMFPGGPTEADVHESEVESWTSAGWRLAE
ncbi:hypothetical protein [Microcystis phage Me-ZS1]|nr:hypothetical protein [Microcystis phage Me-ZS1]